ncbi:MAG: efflux RND transporter permease subunit [Acidobacteria bacterium]|nr:efflux RND transporter permease subunit [Acidobacteriota bacterium]
MTSIPEFSVKRPITVLMMFSVIIIFGLIAYFRLPLKMLPDGFTAPFMHVYIPYPSSTPVEVMNQIAVPVEDELSTVSNIKTLNSRSTSSGAAVWIQFNQGTDMATAYQEVSDRIERVRPLLPDEIDHIYIRKWDPNSEAVINFAINPPAGAKDPNHVMIDILEPRLQRIEGVAKIEFNGLDEKSILIEADIDKIQQHKVNFYGLLQALRKDNFVLSSGYLIEGGRKSLVVTSARFQSLDDIRNLPIGVKDLRIRDIATVKYASPEKKWIFRVARKPGIFMSVYKESGGNTVNLCRNVRNRMKELFTTQPELKGYESFTIWDQGAVIHNSLTDLQISGAIGGLFALLVVFVFLRRFRLTLIVSLSIPFSMLMAILWLYFMGYSLNLLTLMGLMLAVGMLVDNAIVVSENIERLKALGLDNQTAAVQGAREVGLAITLATLTTIVVFLPMMLMGNNEMMKLFMRYVGISIILALLSSLFVALVLIPFSSAYLMRRNGHKETSPVSYSGTRLASEYGKALSWSLSHKRSLFLIILVVVVSTIYPVKNMRKVGDMEGGPRRIGVRIRVPGYWPLKKREAFLSRLENIFYKHQKELEMKTVTSNASMHNMWVNAWLIDERDSKEDITGIMKKVKKLMPKEPGVRIRFRGDHNSAEGGTVNVYFYGKDLGILKTAATESMRQLRNIKGVISADIDMDDQSDEIVASVKREASIQRGVRPIEIESTISSVLRETPLPKFLAPDREINVQLLFRKKNRSSLEQVRSLQIASANKMFPIESLATFKVQQGFQELSRRNKNTMLGVKITYADVDMGKISKNISRVMEGIKLPPGYSWSKGRRFQDLAENDNSTIFALILAATFVLLLMGVLFESFILPFSIIISVPLAFVGSFWLLFLTKTVFNPMASTGTLILIGIVVNNGIVLIDHVNQLRREGVPKREAIIQGSKNRLRPILMTALTTIMGLIPLAVGKSNLVGIPYAPLAVTVIGGLTTSTFLTLFIVPVFYSLLDSLRDYTGKVTWAVVGGAAQAPQVK